MTYEDLCRAWHDAGDQLRDIGAVARSNGEATNKAGESVVDRWWAARGIDGADIFRMISAHPPSSDTADWRTVVSMGLQVGCVIGERIARGGTGGLVDPRVVEPDETKSHLDNG